jgi:hypothetical protein
LAAMLSQPGLDVGSSMQYEFTANVSALSVGLTAAWRFCNLSCGTNPGQKGWP